METKIWDVQAHPEQREAYITEAAEVLRRGGLVAFPTETVYGLGGDALDPQAASAIYAAKGRPSDNPLIVHIADREAITRIVKEIPAYAKVLMDRFWPGPLTLIFVKSDCVPAATTGGRETVAVRLPISQTARALIRRSGGFIAAPSANLSGSPSPTTGAHVIRDLSGRIDGILCGEDCEIGLESTIIDCTGQVPEILRPGWIDREQVETVLAQVQEDSGTAAQTGEARAPGMKYRHYAPQGSFYLLHGEEEAVITEMSRLAGERAAAGEAVGLLVCTEDMKKLGELLQSGRPIRPGQKQAADIELVELGHRSRPQEIARGLYKALRRMDELHRSYILAPTFEESGLGIAIMNRLRKAAGGRIIDCPSGLDKVGNGNETI
ncbi:MAG: L-threonylcarbamoyladenylate synthase [Eubacteriales bacterium]|nr:L-threonylcarbamoyladenylate synthase [Eubacteriales bacterium]